MDTQAHTASDDLARHYRLHPLSTDSASTVTAVCALKTLGVRIKQSKKPTSTLLLLQKC